VIAAVLVSASAGSSRVASRSADSYTADIKLGPSVSAAKCTNFAVCSDFDYSFTNTGNVTYTGMLIQINGSNPIIHFSLAGQRACDATGNKFGPLFQNSWECFPKIAPGETVTGSGTATHPLSKTTTAKIDWTNSAKPALGYATDVSADVPYTIPAGKPVAAGEPSKPRSSIKMFESTAGGVETSTGTFNLAVGLKWSPLRYTHPTAEAETISGDVNVGSTVKVAIDPGTTSCHWMIDPAADFKTGPCNRPIWLPAVVKGRSWSFTITRLLPVGHYVIESRGANRGVNESAFGAAQHNRAIRNVLPSHR
jgi:hypothetical protein